MKLSEIQELIKFVSKSGVSEVELETKDIKIVIKTSASAKGSKVQNDIPIVATVPVAAPVTSVTPIPSPLPQAITSPAAVAAATAEAAAPPAPKEAPKNDAKYVTIKSPMIGTFYRASSPDKPPFVNVGDEIKAGQVICIIEAMKLFNEIESDVSGKIVKVLANDASPVEYDQPLFLIDPS